MCVSVCVHIYTDISPGGPIHRSNAYTIISFVVSFADINSNTQMAARDKDIQTELATLEREHTDTQSNDGTHARQHAYL